MMREKQRKRRRAELTLDDLPNEILFNIISHIHRKRDLINVALSCKRMYSLFQDSYIVNKLWYYDSINPFGEFDTYYIGNKAYKSIIKSDNPIAELVDEIHFNPVFKENHNIYSRNPNGSCVIIYDGKKWNMRPKTEYIRKIMGYCKNILQERARILHESGYLKENHYYRFKCYLYSMDTQDGLKKVREGIERALYRKHKMVMYQED